LYVLLFFTNYPYLIKINTKCMYIVENVDKIAMI
jgi:hypothetical protein